MYRSVRLADLAGGVIRSGRYGTNVRSATWRATREEMVTTENHGVSRDPTKDPAEWTTGEEPMTGPQESYLRTLAQEAGEEVPDDLTKAEASRRIDALQERTGRSGGREG